MSDPAPKPVYLAFTLAWLRAGEHLRTVCDHLSRETGIAPKISIEKPAYLHPRGLTIRVHATAWVTDATTANGLVDRLIGLGAVLEGHEELAAYPWEVVNAPDPFWAVLAVQVRCAEAWASIRLQHAREAFRNGYGGDGDTILVEVRRLHEWAANTGALLATMRVG